MRQTVIIAMLFWTAQYSCPAAADLYRWVDPGSGSVKFSSYPPPWYSEEIQQRGMPKVERIPARSDAPARRDDPEKARPAGVGQELSKALEILETKRKALMASFGSLPRGEDFSRAGEGLRQQVETYDALTAELDRMDPRGAERRRAAAQPLMERIVEGLRAQFNPAAPARER
jgi:hypothetical protein